MLFLKILFGVYLILSIVGLRNTCNKHPRIQCPVNLGTDIASWLINTAITVLLGYYIWG